MVRLWIVLIGALGCNQVYGLGQVELPPSDRDQDGVPDESDNCPDVYNPDQNDTDHDGFGDACDYCPTLATTVNHDEDGDLVGDECDLCPGRPDFQDDSDHDGIGDACDPDPFNANTRLLFDPFLTLSSAWTTDMPWHSDGDAAAPLASLPDGDLGLQLARGALTVSVWQVELGIVSSTRWSPGDRFGIALTDSSGGPIASCIVSCQTTSCALEILLPNMVYTVPVLPTPFAQLRFRVAVAGPLACELDATSIETYINPFPAAIPALIATPTNHITYVDIVN